MRTLAFGVIAAIAACGGGSDGPKTITIDRTADAKVMQLAFRDGDADWQILPVDAAKFEVANGRYLLAAACMQSFGSFELTTAGAVGRGADDEQVYLPCQNYEQSTAQRHDVSMQMAEAGEVRMFDTTLSSSTPSWTATLSAPSGTYALAATDGSRLAIRRGVSVTGPTTLDPLSLATEGKPLVSKQFTLTGATGDVQWISLLYIDSDAAWTGQGTSSTVLLPDASFVTNAGDERYVYVGTSTGYVSITDYTDDMPTTYTLPGPITGVTRQGNAVTWSTLPADDAVSTFRTTDDSMKYESVFVTREWLDGATTLDVDFTTIPSWNPAWSFDGGSMTFDAVSIPDEATAIGSTIQLPGV